MKIGKYYIVIESIGFCIGFGKPPAQYLAMKDERPSWLAPQYRGKDD